MVGSEGVSVGVRGGKWRGTRGGGGVRGGKWRGTRGSVAGYEGFGGGVRGGDVSRCFSGSVGEY